MEWIGIIFLVLQIMSWFGVFDQLGKALPSGGQVKKIAENAVSPKPQYKPCPVCTGEEQNRLVQKRSYLRRKRQGCYNCGGSGKIKILG